jgi:hypothetical protein
MQQSTGQQSTRYIFVTGGVVSSLGKGIAAASLGRLLVERGLRVSWMAWCARHVAPSNASSLLC